MANVTTRPLDHADRAVCIDFVSKVTGDHHPVIPAIVATAVRPAIDVYLPALAANGSAAGVADRASDAAHAAETAFDAAFNALTVAIDDANKKGFAATELRVPLGNRSFSAFLALAPRDKITVARKALDRIADDPRLSGDAPALAAVEKALTALGKAVAAHEAALRTRGGAVRALKDAATGFDKAWGLLVKAMQDYDPDGLGAAVPKFRRGTAPAPAPVAEDAAPADAPAPEEVPADASDEPSSAASDPA